MDKLKSPLSADLLQQSLFADRFPVTYHDCERISLLIDEALETGGFFTMQPFANDMGHVVTGYNPKEEVIGQVIINRPVEAENRRIPSLPWLRHKFKGIGYDFKDPTIRETLKKIERHIRDGGTWDHAIGEGFLRFELSFRGKLFASFTFYVEDKFSI